MKLSTAQLYALQAFAHPGGAVYGTYSHDPHIAERTARALDRKDLVCLFAQGTQRESRGEATEAGRAELRRRGLLEDDALGLGPASAAAKASPTPVAPLGGG